jgi:hypothetical protein
MMLVRGLTVCRLTFDRRVRQITNVLFCVPDGKLLRTSGRGDHGPDGPNQVGSKLVLPYSRIRAPKQNSRLG